MRPPIDPRPGDNRPTTADESADVLAQVYALILSWPTPDEKQPPQERSKDA